MNSHGNAHPGDATGVRPGETGRQVGQLMRGGKPSGLRNPSRAMRGLGSATLAMEALVLLLAIQPLRMIQPEITGPQLIAVLSGAAVAILLTGLLRKRWGWWLGSALQVALVGCGILHWTIGIVGVVFGLVWLYVLHVRRNVLL